MTVTVEDFPDTGNAYALYSFLNRQVARLPTPDRFASQVMQEFSGVWESPVSNYIRDHFRQFASELYQYEQYTDIPPFPADYAPHTLGAARYRDELIAAVFRIGVPDSTIDVIQSIATMMLTHICDLIPPPYSEEVARPDGFIPAIYKMRGISEFISFLLDFLAEEKIGQSAHIFPRLRTALANNNTPASIKLRTQAARDFSVSPVDVVSSHFKDTPLMRIFELQIPIMIPEEFRIEQARLPRDPDHPKHYCYQCKRRLPADFTMRYWQELDFPKGPFFHTEQCKLITLNRHRAPDGDYIGTYRSLLKEYGVFVREYEQEKLAKENVMREKERIERAKMEERDLKEWQRDQERAEAKWEREQAQLRKEQDAEEAARPITLTLNDISESTRFSGTWCIAPQGKGKTVLLAHMLTQDLQRNASIIVMDSKGDLIAPLKQMAAIKDRLILVEPDPNKPLALNPFDIPNASYQHTIALLEYMISGLLGADLTDLQLALTRRIIPIVVKAIPSPTIKVLKDVLLYGLRDHQEHFNKLEPHQQDFMTDEKAGFFSDTYKSTRNQVVWRIDYLMANDVIRSMFDCPKTKFNIAALMDQGKVIVIDNSSNALTEDGCEFFSRFFVYLVLSAAMQRSGREEHQKLPCYFYIDECSDVIKRDQKIARIIDQCRSQRIALILAHQRTRQILEPNVLDALRNCAVRFANSDAEAKTLAVDFRATEEFMRGLPIGSFATFVRDVTVEKTGLIKIPYTDLNSFPKMTIDEQAAIRANMYRTYGYQPERHEAPEGALHAIKKPPAEVDNVAQPKSEIFPQPNPAEPSSDWKP